ncbi:MAG: sugar transferase [Candidatus Adlerbacteria bacterium]|nr:sugar transferase [Candidatus Adlerbacteria bacterium]
MATIFRPRTLVLFAGDLFFFTLALFITLFLRAFEPPSWGLFLEHLQPFSILFALWLGVFFVAGLYESRSIILARRALSTSLLGAQTVNISVAALFFFFVPWFGISPKTILFIYLIVSFLSILLWRVSVFPRLGIQKSEEALVVGNRPEVKELAHALAHAPFAPVRMVEVIDPSSVSLAKDVAEALKAHRVRFIIADFGDGSVSHAFPDMYNFLSAGVRFFDAMALYEEVFGRIPLSILDDRWFARNVSRYSHTLYDPLKRIMDITVAAVGGTLSLVFYPLIILAIKLEDGGPAIISMTRVGEGGKIFKFYKFRSMSGNDNAEYGAQGTTTLKVTWVGKFLRVSRLDELPQFWNVLKGDLSLIGPRPEAPSLVELYEKEIPYYGVRHLIKPGISGWAQLYHDNHPHHGAEVGATREKLSYDLYYLKHRSLALDGIIVLKTLKKLFARSGV